MAPKTSHRLSARSPAPRDQASHPEHPSDDHRVVRRRTRSQSVDLDGNDNDTRPAKQARRSKLQFSPESERVGSVDSNDASDGGRHGKKHTTKADADLSIVPEDPEDEQDEEGRAIPDYAYAEEDIDAERLLQSPGAASQVSQMSGTTAITSASAMTSHSIDEISSLDPILVVECLPELLNGACRILNLLAPPGASNIVVEPIVRELKMIGSRRAKRLNHAEEKFQADRQHYGSDSYINASFIHRALFGNQNLGIDDDSRLDPILHAANLAELVKSLLVTPKESRGAPVLLQTIDTFFPEAFLREFDNTGRFGNSVLQKESFELGLEIRTQSAIAALLADRGNQDSDPEQILLSLFLNQPPIREDSPQVLSFDEVVAYGDAIDIMRAGPTNSEEQNAQIILRVTEIRQAFQQTDGSVEAGDLVDFERLDDMFSWTSFLTQLTQWCRLRLDEILLDINRQGGVDAMVRLLIEAVKNNNNETDVDYDPPAPTMVPRPPPAKTVIPGSAGQSLYDPQAVLYLEQLKQGIPSRDDPPSQSAQQGTHTRTSAVPSPTQSGPSKISVTNTSKVSERNREHGYDDSPAMMEDDEPAIRSTGEYVDHWDTHTRDKNKENPYSPSYPRATSSRRILQPQRSALNQISHTVPSRHESPRPEESENSYDADFQEDQRTPDRNRRMNAPTAQHRSPRRPPQSPPEMVRLQLVDGVAPRGTVWPRQQRAGAVPARAGGRARGDYRVEQEENVPAPSFGEVNAQAKVTAAQNQPYRPQIRTKWTEEDTNKFIELVGKHGPHWAEITRDPEANTFRTIRDQGALKDKARNIKTSYLKAGTPLPENFEKVHLSTIYINQVKAVWPDWTPDWTK